MQGALVSRTTPARQRPHSLCNMSIILSGISVQLVYLTPCPVISVFSNNTEEYQQSMGIIRTSPFNDLRRYNITHALRIPIATSSSRASLQSSLNRLRDDNLTRAIPHTAWSSVDSLVLHFGTLSLTSQAHITAARNILERFNLASSLGNASPLRVTLRGLHSGVPGEQREHTMRLHSYVVCTTDTGKTALLRLVSDLRAAFAAEKLLVRRSSDGKVVVPSVNLMRTICLLSDEPQSKSTMAYLKWSRSPLFHATDTYAAYNDTIWAKDIALEKICISERSLSDIIKGDTIIGEGYKNIACVPFPGFSNESCELQDTEIGYVPAAKLLLPNRIRTSHIIPSNSQPVAPREDTGLDGR